MGLRRRAAITLEQIEADDGESAFLGPLTNQRKAREWALVLASQHIASTPQFSVDGWLIRVPRESRSQALEALQLYERENFGWPPKRKRDVPRYRSSLIVPMAFLALAALYYGYTGPVAGGSAWFGHGRADASLLVSEPWRMVTALTLHADAQHVIGNIISGSIFGAALSRRTGPGGALLAIVVAGALGNAANALYHMPDGHLSIGASTAVFGAVGLLAGVQTVLGLGRASGRRYGVVDFLAPAVGGLALLGTLGSSPDSDLGAHGFGFAAGLLIGLGSGWLLRRRAARPPSVAVQWLAGGATFLLLGGSWWMAFGA